MFRDQHGWQREYEKRDSLFIHDGNPLRPHPLLTLGNHSNDFFDSRAIIADETLLREATADLTEIFLKQCQDPLKVHGVVGPKTGATKLAEFISIRLFAQTHINCFWASPAKTENQGVKSMVFAPEEHRLLPRSRVLLCDDVLNTAGSVEMAGTATMNAGATVLPFILVLVNRSTLTEVNGKKIIALINRATPTCTPEECLKNGLCSLGSKAIRPKEGENWKLLTADY